MKPDTDVELISNDRVAESILCDPDRALVTQSFSCFPSRFNHSAMSFLGKVLSEPQSNKALVSMQICPFDSFMGIICIKKCVLHQVVYLLLLQFVGVTRMFGRLVQWLCAG